VYCLAMSARTSALSGRKRGTATSAGEYCFGFGQSGIDLPVHYVARARHGTARHGSAKYKSAASAAARETARAQNASESLRLPVAR
jgi:hypothetical protein